MSSKTIAYMIMILLVLLGILVILAGTQDNVTELEALTKQVQLLGSK